MIKKHLTKEQKKYLQICQKLLILQQQKNDALKLMQNTCKHAYVVCADEINDCDDTFQYRVCCDCGYSERDKNELGDNFILNDYSNVRVSIQEYRSLINNPKL